jgi:hypothetical protein
VSVTLEEVEKAKFFYLARQVLRRYQRIFDFESFAPLTEVVLENGGLENLDT